MKNWTLRQRILASFAVIIAIMLLMVVASYSRLMKIESSQEEVRRDSLPGVYHSTLLRSVWGESYIRTLELIGEGQGRPLTQTERDQFQGFEASLQKEVDGYKQSIFDDTDKSTFQAFEASREAYTRLLKDTHSAFERGDFSRAKTQFYEQVNPVWTIGRKQLNDIILTNKKLADRATDNIDEAVAAAKVTMFISLLIAIVAAGACGLLLMRSILAPMQRLVNILGVMRTGDLSQRLNLERNDEFNVVQTGFNDMMTELTALVAQAQRSSVQVTTSVTEIAATSKQQQATATETAATTTEIGATSREIAATSRDLLRTMNEVTSAADQASMLAGSGQQGLARMEETMHQISGAASLVNAKLAILNEKAGNINQVVVTIVKVADQTNLLSLNAAIEAEKAGEYGRGFAVVATEVRRLADQTAVATYDIEQMVREIQSAVSAGVMGMDKFSEEVRRGLFEVTQVGEQLSQIIHQVQALAPRVLMVNEGMQAQATGAEQINQALVQLADASSQTVESLRQASFAIDELSQVAVGLRSGVSRFKV
ncbi:methyl-accepting chemotaxis protein [Pseudomonas sp. DTU_2021_1001937_2_SI_NGA_ILE_001]|uniref:methyl-accepting chemotaxis protein n=1 Tax=Pseudomonas sp. DTU_2021_1001937_2_SI_NGA_ILE_001 TaxID=3077589 RepID=UPI0028FC2C9B|nr:methyl-accepting chemotaxis protein [Pseudomonas sp. DTU_2021_1001937_2_SI_NGA_ILE_001]WNW14255.1 methyl-accepting chemotaxis protein [Pseudomonas sp. DTU_2021_1001937_2_SI_NGA_ILE_001]